MIKFIAALLFFALVPMVFAAQSSTPSPEASSSPAKTSVRFLLPSSRFAPAFEKEISAIVDEYNEKNPLVHVELVRRGDHYSSLRELIAQSLASDTPEIAAIESSELPAIENSQIPKMIMGKKSVPFLRTAPVLIVSQEVLDLKKSAPKTWDSLVQWANDLALRDQAIADHTALALPLRGAEGLWIFEAMAELPLWERETGGLRANRALEPSIRTLQRLIDSPSTLKSDDSLERAVQDFLNRSASLLIAPMDLLPHIAAETSFPWKALPLPGKSSRVLSGSDLIVTSSSPDVENFVRYLISPAIASRWSKKGAYLPERSWTKTPQWKTIADPAPGYSKLVDELEKSTPIARSTDRDVVRAHSEWIRALQFLFVEKSKRPTVESVFTELDGLMTTRE